MKTAHTYIIAEIGINHNGSLENCLAMVDAAADAGCDCAKLQFFKASSLYPHSAGRLDWKDDKGAYDYDIYEAVESFEMPEEWLEPVVRRCEERGLDASASVFDLPAVDYLLERGVRTLKLSSYTITHLPLIEYCASKKVPLVMSTGGATLAEVDEAVRTVLAHHSDLALLHCSIQYPTPLDKCNLGVIETYRKAYPDLRVGFSDHTAEPENAPVQTVLLGGSVIEKHITLDKAMPGPDHFFALNPTELKRMVAAVRQAEKDAAQGSAVIDAAMYGSSSRMVYEHERYLREFCYMTLYAGRDIAMGEAIRPEDLRVLRSGKKQPGLEPKHLRLFHEHRVTAKRALRFEEPLGWDHILG